VARRRGTVVIMSSDVEKAAVHPDRARAEEFFALAEHNLAAMQRAAHGRVERSRGHDGLPISPDARDG
jgi:hypothetical protein